MMHGVIAHPVWETGTIIRLCLEVYCAYCVWPILIGASVDYQRLYSVFTVLCIRQTNPVVQ